MTQTYLIENLIGSKNNPGILISREPFEKISVFKNCLRIEPERLTLIFVNHF